VQRSRVIHIGITQWQGNLAGAHDYFVEEMTATDLYSMYIFPMIGGAAFVEWNILVAEKN
jgi:hypothetical protein